MAKNDWQRTGLTVVLAAGLILFLVFFFGPLVWVGRIAFFELRAFWREVIQSSANG